MEPPGTAPGSDPRITGAFIAIVGIASDKSDIGGDRGAGNGLRGMISRMWHRDVPAPPAPAARDTRV